MLTKLAMLCLTLQQTESLKSAFGMQSVPLIEVLESMGAQVAAQLSSELATKADIAEVKGSINTLREMSKRDSEEVRGELKADIIDLKGELKADIAALEGKLRNDITALRGELKQDITELKGQVVLHPGFPQAIHGLIQVIHRLIESIGAFNQGLVPTGFHSDEYRNNDTTGLWTSWVSSCFRLVLVQDSKP
ncbi:MAG: hypothetical protein HQK58_15525 [Deltaproteobacteria bacterium]|nr:hypothetical protein [Deltaproteobacteria bacterium]